ncbi:MAG: amino acid decarboxylase, partial [Gammaproteobacteria bacterium]|nr:amino acid decarboxylase [Gammaproteobacteria bacterium]
MNSNQPYETLDPQDWEKMRSLAHQMIDDSIDYLASVAERPVWQPVPEAVAATFKTPVPDQPADPAEVYDEFLTNIFPYSMGTIHPRFWAWYMGNGTIMGALADLMASVMNPNMSGG